MSDSKSRGVASKWNARYAYSNKSSQAPPPADVLVNGAEFLPESGIAVDIACGLGGNAVYLAQKGLTVFAWDISEAAIESIQKSNVIAEVRDVVSNPPEPNSFDVIVVSRFLDRNLCANLSDALKPDGVIFYQTFTAGLSNSDYLLKENELPALFASLTPCYVYESTVNERGFSEAQFIGRKKCVV